jgi:hypothetical protein
MIAAPFIAAAGTRRERMCRPHRLRFLMTEHALPANIDAERAVLGCVMLRADALMEVAADLPVDAFSFEAHAWIYAAMLAVARRGERADIRTVSDEVRRRGQLDQVGGILYLGELSDAVPVSSGVADYAKIVARTAAARALIIAGGKIAAMGYDERGDPAPTFQAAHRLISGAERLVRGESEALLGRGAWLDELVQRELPDIRWIVPGFVPEGVSLLAGKPKMGKSWICHNLTQAVAHGGMALGSIPVERAKVLYLALEDNDRRLKLRALKVAHDRPVPQGIRVYTEWATLDHGGAALVEAWLDREPETRFVILDTFAKVRPGADPRTNLYDQDYQALQDLRSIADRRQVGILVVHHLRKAASDDPVDLINASTGLAGAVDAILILRRERGESDASLYVTGKDIEEDRDVAIQWDAALAQWSILGDAAEYRLSQERKAILDLIRDGGAALGPKEVADALEMPWASVRRIMAAMANAGELTSERGQYRLTSAPKRSLARSGDHPDHPDQGDQGDQGDHMAGDRGDRSDRGDRPDRGDRGDPPRGPLADLAPAERVQLALYLRGNRESDQEIARDRCARYGIDYDVARAAITNGGGT